MCCVQQSSDTYCILDTIFHPPTDTYYIMDMMCWKARSANAQMHACFASLPAYTTCQDAEDRAPLSTDGQIGHHPHQCRMRLARVVTFHRGRLDKRCCRRMQGYALYDCNAEFRLFWVTSKLAETDAGQPGSSYNQYAITSVPAFHADAGMTLRHCYTGWQACFDTHAATEQLYPAMITSVSRIQLSCACLACSFINSADVAQVA